MARRLTEQLCNSSAESNSKTISVIRLKNVKFHAARKMSKTMKHVTVKEQLHSKDKLSSNERARKNAKKNEPSLTSMRQMVLKISHFKVRNLSKMEVAILKVFSLILTQI